MRARGILVFVIVLFSCAKFVGLAATGEGHAFYGEICSVDNAAKTFSLKTGGKILVFHYNDETKISSFNGHVSWDKIRVGQGAAVVMRLDERNQGIATLVKFDNGTGGAKTFSLYVIRTTSGETISGGAAGRPNRGTARAKLLAMRE